MRNTTIIINELKNQLIHVSTFPSMFQQKLNIELSINNGIILLDIVFVKNKAYFSYNFINIKNSINVYTPPIM